MKIFYFNYSQEWNSRFFKNMELLKIHFFAQIYIEIQIYTEIIENIWAWYVFIISKLLTLLVFLLISLIVFTLGKYFATGVGTAVQALLL